MSPQVSSEVDRSTQSKAAAERDAYLAGLLERSMRAQTGQTELDELRDRAQALVREQTFPTTRDEEWRFTDLSALLQTAFRPTTASITADQLQPYVLPEAAHSRLVFVNGRFNPELSDRAGLPDSVMVGTLSDLQANSQYSAKLGQFLAQQPGSHEVFTALNAAGFPEAAVVWIPKNQVIETPIHLVFVSVADGSAIAQPRGLVVAEANSAVTLVEDFVGFGDGIHLTNAVTEIWADQNAQINHTRVQREGAATYHIGKTAVSQARDSRYTCNAIALGAQLSRHNLDVFQTGEQTDTKLYGLTAIQGQQVADTHSAIVYARPHGTADQQHKCIIDDRAHAIFNGKIFVPREAQLTNASQLNRNLLLSSKARVDTKPQLDIVADNVKCAHGATVSQLDTDEVFYLQSRGIDKASAQRLLLYAFAQEIIEYIPIASLRGALTQQVTGQAV